MTRQFTWSFLAGIIFPSLAVFSQGPQEESDQSRRCRAQLRVLGFALHSYHEVWGVFPPAALVNNQGRQLLSWRVLILPYVGEQKLFAEFRLEEAWDSPHNKKLLARMPKVFAPVRGKTDPYCTYYQIFTGKGTIFQGLRSIPITEIFDGTSNTILAVEAGEAVPWTKPVDLPYAPDKLLPKLGGMFGPRFHFLFADGTERLARKGYDEKELRKAVEPNDGRPLVYMKLVDE